MGAAVLRGRRGRALAALFILAVSMDTYAPLQGAAAMGRVSPSAGACVRPISSPWSGRIDEATGKGALQLRGGGDNIGATDDGSMQLPMLRNLLDWSTALTNSSGDGATTQLHRTRLCLRRSPQWPKATQRTAGGISSTCLPRSYPPSGPIAGAAPKEPLDPEKIKWLNAAFKVRLRGPPPPLRRAPPVPARGEHRDGVRAPGHIGR